MALNNLVNTQPDATTSYFNNYYGPVFDVSQGIDDTAISLFEKITANKETARSLAGAVIYTAKAQSLDPMVILREFSLLSPGELNNYLVSFLNLNRVGTSYLGLSNTPIYSN